MTLYLGGWLKSSDDDFRHRVPQGRAVWKSLLCSHSLGDVTPFVVRRDVCRKVVGLKYRKQIICGKVVRHSLAYLTVHKWVARGGHPLPPEILGQKVIGRYECLAAWRLVTL